MVRVLLSSPLYSISYICLFTSFCHAESNFDEIKSTRETSLPQWRTRAESVRVSLDPESIVVRFPAGRFCFPSDVDISLFQSSQAVYDSEIEACVRLDINNKILPIFDECPLKSHLEGHYCIGFIQSELEPTCRQKFKPNADHQCVQAVAYIPRDHPGCPPGFTPKKIGNSRSGRAWECLRTEIAKPLYVAVSHQSALDNQGLQSGAMNDVYKGERNNDTATQFDPTSTTILQCPNGFMLKGVKPGQNRKSYCWKRIVVPPEFGTCGSGFFSLPDLGGRCVKLTAYDVELACPSPQYRWDSQHVDTPKFLYGSMEEQPLHRQLSRRAKSLPEQQAGCFVERSLATNPRCPKAFELQGRHSKAFCYRKIILPYYTDCRDLEGFSFVWDKVANTGFCQLEYYKESWTAGPNELTRRQALDSTLLRIGETPWGIIEANAKSSGLGATPLGSQRNAVTLGMMKVEPIPPPAQAVENRFSESKRRPGSLH